MFFLLSFFKFSEETWSPGLNYIENTGKLLTQKKGAKKSSKMFLFYERLASVWPKCDQRSQLGESVKN